MPGTPDERPIAALFQNAIQFEKVEDIMEIMKYNVMTTPALVIDDVVTIKGRVPSKDEVLGLLK